MTTGHGADNLARVRDEYGIDGGGPSERDEPRWAGLLAYLLGWVSGLVVFFTQTHPEVRFHAAQSVITFGGLFGFLLLWSMIVGSMLSDGFVERLLFVLSVLLFSGLSLALWGFLCFQGYTLTHFKIPLAGDLAEQWASDRDER